MKKYRMSVQIQWESEATDDREARELLERYKSQLCDFMRKKKSKVSVAGASQDSIKRIAGASDSSREYTLDEFFAMVGADCPSKIVVDIDGKKIQVKMNRQNYLLFKTNHRCCACGLEAKKFVLERCQYSGGLHFNMCGEKDGELIVFTKDHIIPRFHGGADVMENYATLCFPCNQMKSNFPLSYDSVAKLRGIHDTNKHLPRKTLNKLLNQARLQMMESLTGQ